MKKLLNSIFLISGTAIGAGLVALPLMAINIGTIIFSIIVFFMAFLAYKTSLMVVDLNIKRNTACSIVELSKDISGNLLFIITSLSFYILAFSLLTVYLSGIASSLSAFFKFDYNIIVIISGILLFGILNLNVKLFSKLNSLLVFVLLVFIGISIFKIKVFDSFFDLLPLTKPAEISGFVPIIFTSFGVQNICHYICNYLENDRKVIKRAFFIGIMIPAIVYIVWISCVLQNIRFTDFSFFQKLQNHQVNVGELINFLCQSSRSVYTETLLKILTLFAITTSALGIAIGIRKPVKEILYNLQLSNLLTCIIPIIFAIFIPDAFINILSFGGMIATTFVVFVPYILMLKTEGRSFVYNVYFILGIIIVICEILNIIKT